MTDCLEIGYLLGSHNFQLQQQWSDPFSHLFRPRWGSFGGRWKFNQSFVIEYIAGLFTRMCGCAAGLSTVYAFQSKHFRHIYTHIPHTDREEERERGRYKVYLSHCVRRFQGQFRSMQYARKGCQSDQFPAICIFINLRICLFACTTLWVCVCVRVCMYTANIFIDNWQM